MATKAGEARFKDFKQGRTFYEVRMDLNEHGLHDVNVKEVVCGGRPWKKKLTEIDRKLQHPNYAKKFIIHLHEHEWKHLAKHSDCGMFLYVYSKSLTKNDVCFRRLFVTRKAAERFANNLYRYFQPTEAQVDYAIWYHKWEKSTLEQLANSV